MAATAPTSPGSAPVVINEIMYHPPLDLEDLQYVELFNPSESSVNLSQWSFTKGIRFTFPTGTVLAPGSYVIVCRNQEAFAKQYGKDLPAMGNFHGKLSHSGEQIELSDATGRIVDAVLYSDTAPWPIGPDGYSASLERICPAMPSQEPNNWASSQRSRADTPSGTPGRVNDSFMTNLPPSIYVIEPDNPKPNQDTSVTAEVADSDGVGAVSLLYRIANTGGETDERELPMSRLMGDSKRGTYQAAIPSQPGVTLIRFRIKAVDATRAVRFSPAPDEPRPTYSYSTFINTNTARIAFAHVFNVIPSYRITRSPSRSQRLRQSPAELNQGNGAFVYIPPDGGKVLTFDHVQVRRRNGGFKVHFQKDRPFKGMTGINVIFEGPPRWVLAEHLSYELYRLAGAPAPITEHARVWLDGRLLGYQLLIEQPNKSFLSRHTGGDAGNLYKLTWMGQDIVGQHEKKTNPATGHGDLIELIEGLNKRSGADQWAFIQQNFNVEEVINHYAVGMLIQDWDGFFNNHFVYHDSARTGRWEIYPWDKDKTWGDYDGASHEYDWYEMPLTYAMNGSRSSRFSSFLRGSFGGGPWGGGASWWRPPGWFSGPLLANPEFRQRFLARLGELCHTTFTEQKLFPIIDALEKQLEPEIPIRAQAHGENASSLLSQFHRDIQSFRNQVKNRRKFVLAHLGRA